MVASFLHYEVLGPRSDLDRWLGTLQDAGVCHLADALHALEGEEGIGRPDLRAEEVHADLIRSEAVRALRGVARVLPPTPRVAGTQRRPDWTLGPGGMGERDLLTRKDEARGIAHELHARLAAVQTAEAEVARLDAAAAALAVLAREGRAVDGAWLLRLPLDASGARLRRLRRRIAKGAAPVRSLRAERSRVLLWGPAPGDTVGAPGAVLDAAADLGADAHALPAELAGLPAEAAAAQLADRLAAARRTEGEARAALTAKVSEVGPRGRFLLDSLEDAEARTGARRHLASTEHVVAARVYVRPEDEPRLREHVRAAHGDVVVLRPLAAADDTPTLPRRVASAPFAALRGLGEARFGDLAPSALLALLAPLAVGLAWGDLAGGILLLLGGGLLGWRAAAGSPRRDTALLAQLGGFAALVLGALTGRAFGEAGAAWFGEGWGVVPGLRAGLPGGFLGVLVVLGIGAGVLALWGALLAVRAWGRGRSARARALVHTTLTYAVVVGLAAACTPTGHALHPLGWLLAPAALGLLLAGGPRRFAVGLGLELVGILRLVAVGGFAILVGEAVFTTWAPGAGSDLLVLVFGGLALLVAALAVAADPAHVAMGVPYDLALGGRRLGRPFEPFRRRRRDDRDAEADA